MTEENQLIDVNTINAIDVFQGDGLEAVIETVRQAVADFEPDVSTRQGRKDIASMASKVAKSKTFLDAQGKAMVDPIKEQSKVIDGRRKYLRDELDGIRDEVRAPLNEWERADDLRIITHQDGMEAMQQAGAKAIQGWDTMSLSDMQNWLTEAQETKMGEEHWDEFAEVAAEVREQSIANLTATIEKREAFDAERAEMLRLREEEQKRRDAEQALAEEKRQAERDAKIKSDAAAAAEKSLAESIEREKAAERRAEVAKEVAEEAADAKQRALEQAERERAADEEHRTTVNTNAVMALNTVGLPMGFSEKAVSAISAGLIPNVKITY